MREDVPELRVRELVHAAGEADAEVASHTRERAEVQRVNRARRRLEPDVGVLCGDPSRDAVTHRRVLPRGVEVDRGDAHDVFLAVEPSHVRHLVQRDAHRDLELRRRKVDARDGLRHRVLHLEARVHLQERIHARGDVVQVLHGPDAAVLDLLREPHGAAFELFARLARRDGDGAFLDDLLVPSLHAAVAAVQRDRVPVLIRDDLDLEMTRVRGELLDEDRRPRDLGLDLHEPGPELVHVGHHADALPAAALRRLHHERETDLHRARLRFLHRRERRLEQNILRDRDVRHRQPGPAPRDHVDVARLREKVGANLIAHRVHALRAGPQKRDVVVRQRRGQLRVLARVAPPGPHRVRFASPRDLHDQIHVRVVVAVGSALDGDELVRETDVLRVGFQVVLRGHAHDVQDVVRSERLVLPQPQGADRFHRAEAVVRD
eukprot:8871-Pelagococcus_subviridis.AAC.1